MKFKFSLLILYITLNCYSQLSDSSEISVLTIGPGKRLDEKFGHTAIRVTDPKKGLDDVYNYGVFDLEQANFYWNFTKGYMNYKLASYPYYLSYQFYKNNKRWIKQQTLNLTTSQKNELYKFLEINLKPENATYLYDPFYNNCSTLTELAIHSVLKERLIINDNFMNDDTFRSAMNDRINQNTWGGLGINVALGNKLDQKMLKNEYCYLPEYLFETLASATIEDSTSKRSLIKDTTILINDKTIPKNSELLNPFLIFTLLLISVITLTIKDLKNKKRTKWLDFLLLFTSGILGVVILFLWFFTTHSTAINNFNILWAFTPNIIVASLLLKTLKSKLLVRYFQLNLALILAILVIWVTNTQQFSWVLIPLLLSYGIRYWYLQKTLNS